MRAIGKRRKERRILGVHAVSEALQLQIAHDLFLHQTGEVGSGRNSVAGPDFLGDGAAADHIARFEHQDLASGFREICGGDQSVMTAADDDYIECCRQASMIAGADEDLEIA